MYAPGFKRLLALMLGIGFQLSNLAWGVEPKSDFFEVEGVKIHYISAGEGQPVVLVHGLFSSAEMNWRLPGIFGELAKNFHVIAIDLPGHGLSDKPNSKAAYGQQLVEDVVALLDHLKIERAHLVGYSMGGMVSMKLATKHPDRLLSVTMGGMGWMPEGSALQRFWAGMPGQGAGETPISFVHAMADLAITEEALKAIKVPVEVIIGDQDPIKRLYVDHLEKARSDWNVVAIEDAGHLTCVIHPEFKAAIASWIKSNPK